MQHISSELLKLVHRNQKGKMESHSADSDYQQRRDCTYLFRHALPGFLSISQTAEIPSPLWEWEPQQRWISLCNPQLLYQLPNPFCLEIWRLFALTLPPRLQITSLLLLKQKPSHFFKKIKRSYLDWRATSFSFSYFSNLVSVGVEFRGFFFFFVSVLIQFLLSAFKKSAIQSLSFFGSDLVIIFDFLLG